MISPYNYSLRALLVARSWLGSSRRTRASAHSALSCARIDCSVT